MGALVLCIIISSSFWFVWWVKVLLIFSAWTSHRFLYSLDWVVNMPIHFWPNNECLNRLVIPIEGTFIRIPRDGFHASCSFLSWNIRKCLGCLGCVVQLQKEEQGLTIALVWQLLICGSRWWMFVWKMTFFGKYFSLCSVLVGVHNLWQEGMSFGHRRTKKSYNSTFFGV